jgi:large conductance mechanosensitive channel
MSVLKEFREFAVKGNVIDLAVGVIIGAAFGKIVDSVVRDLIMPIVGLAFGKLDFSQYFLALGHVPPGTPHSLDAVRQAGIPVLAYGSFITVALNFVILALIIFFMVKQINRLKSLAEKEKQEVAAQAATPPESPEVEILKEIRDTLKAGK